MALVTILLATGIVAVFCLFSPQKWWGEVEIEEDEIK